LHRSIFLVLTAASLLSAQPEYNQKGGVAVGFPDIINIKYQYYVHPDFYVGLLSFISATKTFGFLPINLPSLCLGIEPYRHRGQTFSPGAEFVATYWIGDQVIKGTFEGTPIDIRANHMLLTLRPFLSIGTTWGADVALGASYIRTWEQGDRHGFDYKQFFSEYLVFPSFGVNFWWAF
jgi:hypothetical protein